MTTKITYRQLQSAKQSVSGRLSRLEYSDNFTKSPIKSIGVFDDEIQQMETVLESMKHRLDNAKITVKI